jgi:zinc protease
VVMNAILGGVFNSRLNLNLRERHGYTYGASSGYEWRRETGPFAISTAVATEVTAAATGEIMQELRTMRDTAPSPEEVSLVISYLDGVFPIRFETAEAIAGALATLRMFDLPDDYYDTYRASIAAVSAEDVAQAAQRHLHPDLLQIVAVGDPAQITPELRALDLGPVREWPADIDPPLES